MNLDKTSLAGAWSAAPTPFTKSLAIDSASVRRMVKHHIRLKQKRIFIAGTCGEGPWLPRADVHKLTEVAAAANNGRMKIEV
jgi:4-hydroxy-tetrahydrodipicolinate synthase